LTWGEAFVENRIDVEGDLSSAFAVADKLFNLQLEKAQRANLILKVLWLWLVSGRNPSRPTKKRGTLGSRERLREAIRFHYDQPLDYWRQWLDSGLLYSCAYFESSSEDLEVAQQRKVDYVCRKLRLSPGDRLLDLGCGWGALAYHAARTYGARVHAVTASESQYRYVANRIFKDGLSDSCRVELADYRDLDGVGEYEKIASVGSIEHVATGGLGEFFGVTYRLLAPGGAFLVHGITANAKISLRQPSFVDRYVFPDSSVVPIGQIVATAEDSGFEVRDVESLREHYELTTQHWLQRIEAKRREVERLVGNTQYRITRLYLAAMHHYFSVGLNNLHQLLLVKSLDGRSRIPLTRADWYQPCPTTLVSPSP